MNPNLTRLQPYPFERLNALKEAVQAPAGLAHIPLSIGEPKHPTPAFISEAVIEHLHGLALYPVTRGSDELREAICNWLTRRFQLPAGSLSADRNVIPVNGTREALFAFAQCVVDGRQDAAVLMPNPFYQIYEGAALLAGAEPVYLNTPADNGYLPDFDAVPEETWQRCQLIYVCSPGNPTGAILDQAAYEKLIGLADRHDFIIASDECYSEIYFDEQQPPPGLLQAAAAMGRDDYKRCVVFHSLSKRSNAPGLRSGFVSGDAGVMANFLRYRTYHGCAMSPPAQAASIRAWNDETHVQHNRSLYREKFAAVLDILKPVLDVQAPTAGFYLWPKTPIPDPEFAQQLFAQQHVTVLPGSFLSRDTTTGNPGAGHVRMALVAPVEDCIEAAGRIRTFVEPL